MGEQIENPLEAEVIQLFTTSGRIALYRGPNISDNKSPMLLLHSVNAAASSFEVKPLFEYFCDRRPVYALDLLAGLTSSAR